MEFKCQLRSLAQEQSDFSVCLLQDRQLGWSPCAWSFSSAVCVEETNPWSFSCTLDLLRCLGLELFSFRALLLCLVFDCGMGCMSLYLLVKVWVPLKLQSIALFYKFDCPLFIPSLRLFLFHFFIFPGPKIAWRSLDLKAFCLYSCCFWSYLPWGCFSR